MAADAPARGELIVLYGSQTGCAQEVAEQLELDAIRRRFAPRCLPMDAFDVGTLPNARAVLFVCSTTGQGEPPDNMRAFWRFLLRKGLPATALAGVSCAVFGLGDSSYPKFNYAARRLSARLRQLGARALAEPAYGDEQDELGVEQALQPWLTGVWAALDELMPLPPGLAPLPDDVPPPARLLVQPAPADARPLPAGAADEGDGAEGGARAAYVLENAALTTDPATRDVRHLTLLLPLGAPSAAPAAPTAAAPPLPPTAATLYEAGDALEVWPVNAEADVERALRRLQASAPPGAEGALAFDGAAAVLAREARPGAAHAAARPLPARPVQLRELLARWVDLSAVPRRATFAHWARYAVEPEPTPDGAPSQRARLAEFGAPSGQALLRAYASRPRRTVLECLEEFGAVALPLGALLDALPPLLPRAYSVCAHPLVREPGGADAARAAWAAHAGGRPVPCQLAELCVARVAYRTSMAAARTGLCSAFLARQAPPEPPKPPALPSLPSLPRLLVRVRRGALRMPADERAPLLLLGPGTGVAPLRAFVQRRVQLARAQPARAPRSALFFGCRSAALDHLWEAEWAAACAAGVLAPVPPAFSRDGPRGAPKSYVQHRLREPAHAALAAEIVRSGGSVYVAGAAGSMPAEVREALVLALAAAGGAPDGAEGPEGALRAAEAEVRALEAAGRYQTEVWS